MRTFLRKVKDYALKAAVVKETVLNDERGSLSDMVWVIGAAVVVALVIVGAMVFAPQTATSFWNDATSWIRSQFGF